MSFLVEELFDLTVSAFKVFHRTLQLTEERLPSWTAFQPYSLMYRLPLTSFDIISIIHYPASKHLHHYKGFYVVRRRGINGYYRCHTQQNFHLFKWLE